MEAAKQAQQAQQATPEPSIRSLIHEALVRWADDIREDRFRDTTEEEDKAFIARLDQAAEAVGSDSIILRDVSNGSWEGHLFQDLVGYNLRIDGQDVTLLNAEYPEWKVQLWTDEDQEDGDHGTGEIRTINIFETYEIGIY